MWCGGRVEGYRPLEAAVDADGVYDAGGALTAAGYRFWVGRELT